MVPHSVFKDKCCVYDEISAKQLMDTNSNSLANRIEFSCQDYILVGDLEFQQNKQTKKDG